MGWEGIVEVGGYVEGWREEGRKREEGGTRHNTPPHGRSTMGYRRGITTYLTEVEWKWNATANTSTSTSEAEVDDIIKAKGEMRNVAATERAPNCEVLPSLWLRCKHGRVIGR